MLCLRNTYQAKNENEKLETKKKKRVEIANNCQK